MEKKTDYFGRLKIINTIQWMFLDESTVTTTSTPDQTELTTDVTTPFLVESVNRWRYTSKFTSKLHVLVYTGACLIFLDHRIIPCRTYLFIKHLKLRYLRVYLTRSDWRCTYSDISPTKIWYYETWIIIKNMIPSLNLLRE